MSRAVFVLVVLCGAVAMGGCASDPTQGYSSESLFSDEIATVAVPMFANPTVYRDIESELTEAIIKEIESRTPYRVTRSGGADSILSGRIRSVNLDRLSASRQTGLGEEMVMNVAVDFQWTDTRTGREMVARQDFSGHGLFLPSAPLSEPIELGRFTAVQQLARDIVDEMRADW